MNLAADVIIAGAGPAGSIAAYYLAKQGIRVLILEKETFPRYKSCGGGLTQKTRKIIPFDIGPVIEREIREMAFTIRFRNEFRKKSNEALITTVMRDQFDHYLLEQAVKQGAEVRFNVKALSVITEGYHVEVHTTAGDFKSRLLIAADGAKSTIARSLCLMEKNIYRGFAVEYELRLPPGELDRFGNTIYLDWGTVPTGYAWLFPKKDHISVGVGCINDLVPCLKHYYEQFIENSGIQIEKVLSMKGHALLSSQSGNKITAGYTLLAGDAAGLTDPMTGEGIYYAIRSGEIAAEFAIDFIRGKHSDIRIYQKRIEKELMPELSAAWPLLYYFNAWPSVIHNYIRNGKNGWKNFVQVLEGKLTYKRIPKKLKNLRFLFGPVSKIAQLISFIKRKTFRMNKINCEIDSSMINK